ncbi:MAG TPA: Plug domain-containing protein [Gemmatimonadales bacterium]|nr:Plug domain-containing protein [Gemmatimonadales bacterium]
MPGAAVRIGKDGPTLTSDSAGRVVGEHLPAGWTEITIKRIGYEPGVFDVRVPDSGSIEGVFPLDFNGYLLPAVVVEAHAEALSPRYTDFERRRHRALGAYLRWDELKRKGYSSVGDALRTVRGVRIQCNQQEFECNAVMVRTPQCTPTWYIDGVEARSFHANTPIADIYGIEVYRGAGEIPAEFGGSNAACGVIVVWTKSKPYR